MNSFRIGMNSFRIKLSKGTILPFSFLLQLPLRNWKLCFLILSLHKKFYFLALFVTPNSSIYLEWFHSGTGFFIVLLVFLLQNFKKKRQCGVDLDGCNLPMHFPRSPALWWDITLITIFLWRHLFGFLISTSSVKSVALLVVLVLCSFYELKCKIGTDILTS